ncbi:MAG: hypothetical protein LBV01_05535 [Deltaproteobacteria bacterium]|jgi:hypothetical protein|nr:hypothetical protein [Deltaproteobacteria bacterium]
MNARCKGVLGFLFCLCVLSLCAPEPAYAYLDPGTGNILVYVLVSLVSALLYFCKNFWYGALARFGGKSPAARAERAELVIFSEGRVYWPTFKSIVAALLEKKMPFRYVSMDIHDPGLAIANPLMQSRYVGTGSAAFARVAGARGSLMLSTTPNIGTPGYPMPAPRNVKQLVHVLHSLGGMGFYYRRAFDCYDVMLLMGEGCVDEVRRLEATRGLPAKECVSAGVPCFDEIPKPERKGRSPSEPPVVLVAPSWGEKSCLNYCGTAFIEWLANAGYEVIVRLHPFSYKVESAEAANLAKRFAPWKNVGFDTALTARESFARADMMISDKSCVRFDFAFTCERPVLTLDVPAAAQEHFEISVLGTCWEQEMETLLGPVIAPEDFRALSEEDFLETVRRTLAVPPARIEELRGASVANIGRSGEFIADWLIARCALLASEDGGAGEASAGKVS